MARLTKFDCGPVWLALCGFLALAFLCDRGNAAGFSCRVVKTSRERLICTHRSLLRADEKLTAAYKAAVAMLSTRGGAELRKEQYDWLSYTQSVCWIGRNAPAGVSSSNCLGDEYRKRQKQLDRAVIKADGVTIRRVDRFSAAPSAEPGSGGSHPGFNTTVISFPQIDQPNNERERAWNELIARYQHAGELLASASAKPSDAPQDENDLWVDYTLGSVSPTMISLWFLIYDDAHGAHGTPSDEGITWLLSEGRALRGEDIFDTRQPWRQALARLVFEATKREVGEDLTISEPSAIVDQASDPAHWLIGKRALVVRFVDKDAPSCCSAVEADIPWRVLAPYLTSRLPFQAERD